VIYKGCRIEKNIQSGHHIVIRKNTVIGSSVSIGTLSNLEHNVLVEENVRIHSKCFIPEYTKLRKMFGSDQKRYLQTRNIRILNS